jgi:coproporphyrinogen III oxidase
VTTMRDAMRGLVFRTQDEVCAALAAIDGTPFATESWDRDGGGGGWSRFLQDGAVFEKAGVNVSEVHGTLSEAAARAMRASHTLPEGPLPFWVTGVSLVVHPHSPMVPTVHANYRYFEVGEGERRRWWFGGGTDLTPSYLFDEDASHFHRTLKAACDRHDPAFYPRFKAWCDDYFHVVHRGERRGIGGIFFDDLDDRDPQALFAFASDCAAAIVPAYVPIVERRLPTPFTDAHKRWQQLRRGRYVEFNLVHDRGTLFGLKTAARIDSVLMSLPLTARWEVGHQPEPGSEEARLLDVLITPREWAS